MIDHEALAAWVAAAPPGGVALLSLDKLDPQRVSVDGNIAVNAAIERTRAALDAWQTRSLARLTTHPDPVPGAAAGAPGRRVQDARELARMSVTADLAGALHWSYEYTANRMDEATKLVRDLPATLAAVGRGELSLRHAQAFAHATIGLDPTVIGKVEAAVLGRAATQTVAQFRRAVRTALATVDPRDAAEQHQAEAEQRRVAYQPADHAMAWINAYLPAPDAQAVMVTVQAVADKMRAAAGPDDARSADQYRADALVAICQAALNGDTIDGLPTWQGRRPHVQVIVALSTLLGIDHQPGQLAGYGPIPADLARKMAADPTGTWRRLVTDELGQLVDYGRTTYRPPQDLIDHVTVRDRTCRGPGCHRSAQRSEIDHIVPWSKGGETNAANLAPACRRHHHLKDDAGWQVVRLSDGTVCWTSPTGRTYHKPPEIYPADTTLATPEPSEYQDEPPPF